MLAVSLALAGCAPGGAITDPVPVTTGPTTTAPVEATAPPPSAVPATPTTMPAAATLVLDPIEALAATGGVVITAEWDGGRAELSASAPRVEAAVAGALAGPVTVTFSYPAESTDPDPVRWSQSVPAGATVTVRQPWRQDGTAAGDVVLVWQALGDRASYRGQLDAAPGVTVTSPVWWFIRADGSLADESDAGLVADAHDRGIAVWPAVASLDADANHAAFSDPAQRSDLAAALSERAEAIGADGVNVDVEGYRREDTAGVTAFIEELTDLVHGWGGVVSYDLIPRTDTWEVTPAELSFWSTAPQRREIAAIVDYTVVMAYDQYNRYRPAGPVAAPAWVEDVVTYALRFVDPHRLILGVPFYGRVWDAAEPDRPRAVGIGRLPGLGGDAEPVPDPAFGLDRVDLPDGRFFWLETPGGLQHRTGLVAALGLAGWAAWRLGFDSPAVWEAVAAAG